MGWVASAMRVALVVAAMAAVAARRHEATSISSLDSTTAPRESRRQLVTTQQYQYCIQPSSNHTSNATTILQPDEACWQQQPSNATNCVATPPSNSTTSEGCWCEDARCVVYTRPIHSSDFQLAYCTSSTTFVANDGHRRTWCREQVHVGRAWTHRPADQPAGLLLNEAAFPFWRLRCWLTPYYQWKADDEDAGEMACLHTTRYLGETCWDNSRCQQGDAEPYDAHRVSCARVEGASTARCVPTLLTNRVPRQPCACNRGTQSVYNLLSYFSCQSSDCNGHQCVLTTEDMNMYCDWNTEHSQSLLPLLLRQMAYSAYNSALSTALREALFGVVNTVTGYFSA